MVVESETNDKTGEDTKMRTRRALCISVAVVALIAIVGAATTVLYKSGGQSRQKEDVAYAATSKSGEKPKPAVKTSPTETAIRAAAKQKRYIFVTFYKRSDPASDKMLGAINTIKNKLSGRANFARADVDSPVHAGLVKRYGVGPAAVPVTLVLAPNGAVTGAFPREIKTDDFSNALVSNGLADVLKVLQGGKLAVVCIQNGKTKFNKQSLAAAKGLQADSRLSGNVGIVKIDPSARSESKFLRQCKVDTGSANAQILLLVPPGRLMGKFDGAITKGELMAGLQEALKSCGTGCGPTGCGP